MARRSTRLSARKSSTPQPRRVSTLEHDGALRTPRTAPRMASLTESDEMPGAFPKDSPPDSYMTDEVQSTPTRVAAHLAQAVVGSYHTPRHITPVKPDAEEMHPQNFQVSTAKPDEEARWVGFSNMAPHTEPAKGAAKLIPAPGTPSKTPKAISTSQPSDFQFTFRAGSLELSEEARKFMAEKREEAAKIKKQMMEEEESQRAADTALGRKLATAKGRVGRFSDVHMAQFKKMDSIADHASVTRPAQSSATSGTLSSLKRSSSKAGLAQGSRADTKPVNEGSASKNKFSSLPRSNSTKSLGKPVDGDSAVSAKRFKRVVDDDAGTSRPASSGSDSNSTLSTPKGLRFHSSNPHLKAATPTAASLARQASIKTNKTSMIPSLSRSPSKSALTAAQPEQQKPATPFLARSPSKNLLAPSRLEAVEVEAPASPLLSRSPSKPIVKASVTTETQEEPADSSKIPFLARSPSKMSITQHQHQEDDKPSKTPLLSRSPSKPTKDANPFITQVSPSKTGETSLMDRLKLLRASPMKSILRSPQRLYSDDPSKIASGTHVATPEKAASTARFLAIPPKTEPVRKHVDFTASTKGLNENDAVDSDPSTPSKEPPPPLREIKTVEQAKLFYPPLPTEHTEKPASIKKFNRRMTLGADVANDFTFRVGGGISFAPSISAAKANLKSSIRHVSVEPEMISTTPTRKRKFTDGEDSTAVSTQQIENPSSDKENDQHSEPEDEARPAKRVRQSEAISRPVQPTSNASTQQKRLTLGVKPKNAPKATAKPKDKRAGFLSRDRLNMLAMPKRRTAE